MKLILIFLFLCYSLFGVGQTVTKDYRHFFQLASYAKYKLKTGSPDEYITILKSLAAEYKQCPFEYAQLGSMLFERDTSEALFYMRLAISKGYRLSSLLNKFDKESDKVYLKEILSDDYNDFLSNRNNDFVNFLDSLIETDQLYRAQTFDLPDSIRFMKQESIDSSNLMKLKTKIEQYGWPGYSMVGHDYAGVAFIVVLHGTRQFAKDSEVFQFFESLLMDELITGNFSPVSYSNWMDQYHAVYLKLEQPFGSMANVDGVLFPIKNIEECNKNRLSIGLLPLNQYLMLTGYRIE